MNAFKTTLLATALLATLGISSAHAATATASFGVQLVVLNSCTVTAGATASDLNFPTVTGNITTNRDATTTLTVNCNNGALYSVGLGDGANALVAQRRMFSAVTGAFVNYELYRDLARAERWSVLGTANNVAGTGTNANQTLTVHGRVPGTPLQSVGAGTYNDTIIATIEF